MDLLIRHLFHRKPLTAAVLALLLTSCATSPVATVTPAPPPEPAIQKIADKQFESDTLYALLVAEFAGTRKRFDVMLNNYVQQAKHTKDIEVTARASQLARFLGAHDQSLSMAQQWVELEPRNVEAHFNATVELIHANQLSAAMPHAIILLENSYDKTGFDAIAARAAQINDESLTADLARQFESQLTTHPEHISLLVGLSLLEQQLGNLEQALALTQKAHALDAKHFQSAAQGVRILEAMGRKEEALTQLGLLVERFPQNTRLRLQYARALIKTDLIKAQEQFLTLLRAKPKDWDIAITTALIQFELKEYSEAKALLLRLTDEGNQPNKHRSTAHGYLGRIALIEGNKVTAKRHFAQVTRGADYLPSLSKLTDLYIESHSLDHAITHLVAQLQRSDLTEDQQTGIALIQSRVYNKKGDINAAITALSAPLETKPDNIKLLYARAMLLGDNARLNEAEQDLKHVLALNPKNAAALNALGYTLADKTQRYEEAYQYIRQAYELTPEDPAVIDSLGWVEYKRGNVEVALKYLKNAFLLIKDHEISAHLGEVLWVAGQKEAAIAAWKQGLASNPSSSVLRRTLQRFGIDIPEP